MQPARRRFQHVCTVIAQVRDALIHMRRASRRTCFRGALHHEDFASALFPSPRPFWRSPRLTACVAPAPVYQTSRYPYQPRLQPIGPVALHRIRPRRQHRGAAQPDRGHRHHRRRCGGRRRRSAAWSATSSATAAAVRRRPRWAWSAARCWATASKPTATPARLRKLPRLGPDRQRRLPLLRRAAPRRPAHRRPRAHRKRSVPLHASQAPDRALRASAARSASPEAPVRPCTLKKPVPAVPRPISSSVASRTDFTVRSSRIAMPASGWLPSSTTCSG